MKRFLLLSLVLAFTGCASVGHLPTPSGKPEVVIHGSIKDVQRECLAWLLSNGFMVDQQYDTKNISLTGAKDVTSGLWKLLPGNQDVDGVVFNFLERDSTVTVYATSNSASIRAQSGTQPASKSYTDNLSQDELEFLQKQLLIIKNNVETHTH